MTATSLNLELPRLEYELSLVQKGLPTSQIRQELHQFELGQLDKLLTKKAKFRKWQKDCKRTTRDFLSKNSNEAPVQGAVGPPPKTPSLSKYAGGTALIYGFQACVTSGLAYSEGKGSVKIALKSIAGETAKGASVGSISYALDKIISGCGVSVPNASSGLFLVASTLSESARKSIGQWWRGEITGSECLKLLGTSVSEATFGAVGVVVGAKVGYYVGGLFGPWGKSCGALLGGIVGRWGMKKVSDDFANWLFGVEKPADALAAAYAFLGVHPQAPDIDVRRAYLRKCVVMHPDRNGNTPESNQQFIRLQAAYELILQARMN